MASNVEAPERWYLALLGFAEHFRTSSPPKIRLCVHCLQAVFQFKPPQRIEARTHLQLGSVLYHHTKNSELARNHLEQAVRGAWSGKERGCCVERERCRPRAHGTAIGGSPQLTPHCWRSFLQEACWKFAFRVEGTSLVVVMSSGSDGLPPVWSTVVHCWVRMRTNATFVCARRCSSSGLYLSKSLNLKMWNSKRPASCPNFTANRFVVDR